MISSYRLGDLVLIGLADFEEELILAEYPNSIASKYILQKRIHNKNNIHLITNIVVEHIAEVLPLLPQDIQKSTVVHLRLGDVVCGNEWHEKLKRPYDVQYIHSLIPVDNYKTYVIGKCFFAYTSSKNYDECINASNTYLQNILNTLNAEHFDSGIADVDLCCAVMSKCFIQGKGYFSQLIVEIRKQLQRHCIENDCLIYTLEDLK